MDRADGRGRSAGVAAERARARCCEAARTTQAWQLERTLQIRSLRPGELAQWSGEGDHLFRTQTENLCDQART